MYRHFKGNYLSMKKGGAAFVEPPLTFDNCSVGQWVRITLEEDEGGNEFVGIVYSKDTQAQTLDIRSVELNTWIITGVDQEWENGDHWWVPMTRETSAETILACLGILFRQAGTDAEKQFFTEAFIPVVGDIKAKQLGR